jgi:plastocyanin
MNFVPAQVEAIHVIINNSVFSPVETKAKAGDMVTSIDKDIIAHTATVHGGFDVAIETNTSASSVLTKAGVARQSGWKRCGELDGQFGGRGEEMIVAPRQ